MREPAQVVEQFGDVQVLHDDFALILRRFGSVGRLVLPFLTLFLAHGSLEFAAVDVHHACRAVVGHNLELDDGIFEVLAGMEAMQLVELGDIEPHFYQCRVLESEALALLECHILHSHMGHAVEVVVPELVELQLYVGLYNAMIAGGPLQRLVATGHIGEIQIVIAVVHQIGIKGGGVQVFEFLGIIGEHHIEHLTLLGLEHRFLRHGLGRFGGFLRLHQACLDVERFFVGHGTALLVVNHDHITRQGGTLKSVLVFHIHHFAVDASHFTASHIVQEAHYIVYFNHIIQFLCLFYRKFTPFSHSHKTSRENQ